MKIKRKLPILLTMTMALQIIPVFAVNNSNINNTDIEISQDINNKKSELKSVGDRIGKPVEVTSEKNVPEIKEEWELKTKSNMLRSVPIVNGVDTSEILSTKDQLDEIKNKKLNEKDSQSKTTSIIYIQDMVMYIKNGENKGYLSGEFETFNIKTGSILTYEDIKQFKTSLQTEVPITEVYYSNEGNKDNLIKLDPKKSITVKDGLIFMRVRVANEDKDSDNKDEPKKPYNPSNDPTADNKKSETTKYPGGIISIEERNYTFKNTEDYVRYLQDIDKENKERIKKLNRKEKQKLEDRKAKGMLTFKGFEYYDNGNYKDIIAQKNLIVSMVNLLKTKVGILNEEQIGFLGGKIDESKLMIKDSEIDKNKIEKYTEAFNKVRKFIEENSDVKNTDLDKVSRSSITPTDLGERPAIKE